MRDATLAVATRIAFHGPRRPYWQFAAKVTAMATDRFRRSAIGAARARTASGRSRQLASKPA